MKKNLIMSLASVVACVSLFSNVASAETVVPGTSDYSETNSVVIADVKENFVELTDPSKGTVIKIDKSALPDNVKSVKFNAYTVDPKVEEAMHTTAKKANLSPLKVFSFKLHDENGAPISQLKGTIDVTVAAPAGAKSVFYFDDKANTVTNHGGNVSADGKYITFKTDHFSYYGISGAVKDNATAPNGNTTSPSTGDNTSVAFLGLIVLVSAGALVVGKKVLAK